MTYFDAIRVKQDLNLTNSDYDSQINGVWGPDGDDEIDNLIGAYETVPLTTIPEIIKRASNQYVEYRYYDHLHMEEKAKSAYDHFTKIMESYILRLKQSTNLLIRSQSYRTYPLNPDATPYRSISGSSSSTDDSDL